jgi:hypothetical protein
MYRHWRGLLYPEGLPQRRWLERYVQFFDTVEMNATFYRLPDADRDLRLERELLGGSGAIRSTSRTTAARGERAGIGIVVRSARCDRRRR